MGGRYQLVLVSQLSPRRRWVQSKVPESKLFAPSRDSYHHEPILTCTAAPPTATHTAHATRFPIDRDRARPRSSPVGYSMVTVLACRLDLICLGGSATRRARAVIDRLRSSAWWILHDRDQPFRPGADPKPGCWSSVGSVRQRLLAAPANPASSAAVHRMPISRRPFSAGRQAASGARHIANRRSWYIRRYGFLVCSTAPPPAAAWRLIPYADMPRHRERRPSHDPIIAAIGQPVRMAPHCNPRQQRPRARLRSALPPATTSAAHHVVAGTARSGFERTRQPRVFRLRSTDIRRGNAGGVPINAAITDDVSRAAFRKLGGRGIPPRVANRS